MKFSIITPTYNRAHTIERTVKSILEQTYQNFEMIIIDDGSIDDTYNVIEKYLNDKRIQYIGPNSNGGVNVARNIGLQNVSDDVDWITFLDSDDEFLPNALEKMYSVIRKNENYQYFRFSVVYADGSAACFAKNDNIVLNYENTLKQKDVSGEWVVTFSKKILENGFKFEESVNAFESISWFELSKKELCLYSLETVRVYQLDTEGLQRQSVKTDSYYKNQIEAVTLFFKYHGENLKKYNKQDYATKLYMLSHANIKLKRYKQGIINLIKAVSLDPLNSNVLKKIFKFKL